MQSACGTLEEIVAKWKHGLYLPDEHTSWLKIKNRNYSQAKDRHELFDKFRRSDQMLSMERS